MGDSMKKILVATDGSEGAGRAIDYAAGLAREQRAVLLIVSILGGYGLPGKAFRRLSDARQAWLKELLESASSQALMQARDRALKAGAPRVLLESRGGDVAPTILKVAQESEADLVVVGKRGAGRVGGLLLGSVSQRLVSLARLPVTVVP